MNDNLKPLGTVAKVRSGYAFRSEDMGVVGVPLIKIKNVIPPTVDVTDCERVPGRVIASIPNADRYAIEPGDILIAMTGATVGKVGRFPQTNERFYLNQRVGKVYLTEPDKADYRYLYYVLSQDAYVQQMLGTADGSAQANISGAQIERLEIPLPAPTEQRAIARVLGALDDKIELNRRMNETLETVVHTIFARLRNGSTGTKKINELVDINSQTLSKQDDFDVIEYIEISEVSRGNVLNTQVFQRGKEPSRARRKLRHGDTVLSTVRPDRRAYFLCLNPSRNLIASTGFAVVSPIKAPWSFIHAALTQSEIFDYLGQQADGGAYPAVRPEVIGDLEVPWPSDYSIVEEFDRLYAPLYERAENNRRESRTLVALRNTLVPKLLSGEISVVVKNAEDVSS